MYEYAIKYRGHRASYPHKKKLKTWPRIENVMKKVSKINSIGGLQ